MKRLSVIALGVTLFASLAFAEEATKRVVPRDWTQDPKVFYGRVATFLGVDAKVGEALGEEFVKAGMRPADGVLLMLYASKQTQRQLREQKITSNEVDRSFRDGVTEFLAVRQARSNWRETIATK